MSKSYCPDCRKWTDHHAQVATIDSLRSDLAALSVRVEEAEGERDEALRLTHGERSRANLALADQLGDAEAQVARQKVALHRSESERQVWEQECDDLRAQVARYKDVVEAVERWGAARDVRGAESAVYAHQQYADRCRELDAALARLRVDSEPTTEPTPEQEAHRKNDAIWGPGNWRYCNCSMDDTGQRVAHSLFYQCSGARPTPTPVEGDDER